MALPDAYILSVNNNKCQATVCCYGVVYIDKLTIFWERIYQYILLLRSAS